MSLRIEVCDLDSKNWSLYQKLLPGQAHMLDQILQDGEKVYIADCDISDEQTIIYESIIPANKFREKIIRKGVHNNEDFEEMVIIKKGETYKMSIKNSEDSERLVFRFLQEQ